MLLFGVLSYFVCDYTRSQRKVANHVSDVEWASFQQLRAVSRKTLDTVYRSTALGDVAVHKHA